MADGGAPPAGSALAHLPAQLRFWIILIAALAFDLWSKAWAFSALGPHEEYQAIPGWLMFRRSLNDGAVFGSFTGQVGLFIVASIFALIFVFHLFSRSHPRAWVLHTALALILAGALGNLYDRAFMKADVVRDPGGRGTMMIGRLVEREGDSLLVGEWPEGSNVQSFREENVLLVRQGVVRDFIKFEPVFPKWVPRLGGSDVWPWVFNIADSALVCGVIILLLTSGLDRHKPTPAATGAA